MSEFLTAELNRYARHFNLKSFGQEGQIKLKKSKVLVIGAGGLGSPMLLYLAAAGIGQIGIVEFDTIDISNLQRQILYTEHDVGESKVAIAKKKLQSLNPHIDITIYNEAISTTNALKIIEQYDVVADGSDNFATRYLVNDACVISGKPLVYGAIFQFEGQVAVFNYKKTDGTHSTNYRDLFPSPPAPNLVPNCAEAGVLGVLPGIIGSMQAAEVIKVLTNIGEPLVDKLYLFDLLDFSSHTLKIKKRKELQITKLIDYDAFCGLELTGIKEISVNEFLGWKKEKIDFQLIDVRTKNEYDNYNISGKSIPLNHLEQYIHSIKKDKKVVIHCQSGQRSIKAIELLERNYGFKNLYNLKGGINAWRKKVTTDTSFNS